jgi:hypothetical protein
MADALAPGAATVKAAPGLRRARHPRRDRASRRGGGRVSAVDADGAEEEKPGTHMAATTTIALPRPLTRAARLRGLAGVILAGLLASLAGCAADPPPKSKSGRQADSAEEAERFEKSRKLLREAQELERGKSFDRARKLLKQAAELGVEADRFAIDETLEKVDKRQAKLWANEVSEKLDEKDCDGAFKDLAKQIQAFESDAFARELRSLVATKAVACVSSTIDEGKKSGKLATARALVGAAETKTVLGPPASKKAAAELDAAVGEVMRALVAADVKARKWADAVAKLDAAVKAGDASEAHAAVGLEAVREAIAPEIAAMATKAVGQGDAAGVLKQVNELVKVARWEVLPPDVAELRKKVDVRAIWVEAQRQSAKVRKSGDKRWVIGKAAATPAVKSDGESKRDLGHATEVWLLAETKTLALVADAEPKGSLAEVLEKATGWVPLARLARQSTADWLLPGDELKGARVWGPLRPPSADLELGVVTEVAGKDVTVKRLADDAPIKVARASLRSGRLAVGTKVLTFCTAKDQPAVVEELLTAGRAQPGVKLKCESGQEKEDLLPSLRTRADLLPKGGP